jgi:hypothetical protein
LATQFSVFSLENTPGHNSLGEVVGIKNMLSLLNDFFPSAPNMSEEDLVAASFSKNSGFTLSWDLDREDCVGGGVHMQYDYLEGITFSVLILLYLPEE